MRVSGGNGVYRSNIVNAHIWISKEELQQMKLYICIIYRPYIYYIYTIYYYIGLSMFKVYL